MKKMLCIRLLPFFLLAGLVVGPERAACQNSEVYKYTQSVGDSVLIRTNQARSYRVISFHDSHKCSSFIVDNNTTRRGFATTSYNTAPTPGCLHKGYVVKDMAVLGTTCWFCGYEWIETGRTLYTLEGLQYPEVLHYGYVGRFNVVDVINQVGTFEVMRFADTRVLTSLAVYDGGLSAVGQLLNFNKTCFLEMKENSSGTGVYHCRIDSSSYHEEEFMDVVWAGGKVVTLSRFDNPQHVMFYKYRFGLRYGSPLDFTNTSTKIYCYDVSSMTANMTDGCFDGLKPVRLAYANCNNEVIVSYLGSKAGNINNPFAGKVLSYRVPSEGSNTVMYSYSQGSGVYSELKDVRYSVPTGNTSLVSFLLEDSLGQSVIRYPNLSQTGTRYDTIIYTDVYNLESVMPLNSGNFMSIYAAGNNATKNIVEVREFEVNNYLSIWPQYNCLSVGYGEWKVFIRTNTDSPRIETMIVISEENRTFSQKNYIKTNGYRGMICENGD